jgi:hypothetical protein
MAENKSKRPAKSAGEERSERRERLARALRDNLRRRKGRGGPAPDRRSGGDKDR